MKKFPGFALLWLLFWLLLWTSIAFAQSPPGPPGMLRDASNALNGSWLQLQTKNNDATNGLIIGGTGVNGTNYDLEIVNSSTAFVCGNIHNTPVLQCNIFLAEGQTGYNPPAGQLEVAGSLTVLPTLGGNGAGAVFTSTINGLDLMGQGTTNDVTLFNSSGVVAAAVTHGTTTFTMQSALVIATSGTNPAAGQLELGGQLASPPTLGGNGAAAVYTSATNGLFLTGQGSVNDLEITNSANTLVANIAHGTTTFTTANLTVTTTLTIASITGSTQCLQVNSSGVVSGTGCGTATTLALTGALGAPAAGTLLVSGSSSPPTLAANNEGAIWITSTGGVNIEGQGSSNDLTLLNHSGSTVCTLPFAQATLNCVGFTVTGSVNPINGMYLPTANTVGFVANSTLAAEITSTGLNSTVIGATTPLAATFTSLTVNSGGSLAGTFSGAPTFSGNVVFSGEPTIIGSVAMGAIGNETIAFGVGTSPISMGTQSGAIFLATGGNYGIQIQGNGGNNVNDVEFVTGNGTEACGVPHNAVAIRCGIPGVSLGQFELTTASNAFNLFLQSGVLGQGTTITFPDPGASSDSVAYLAASQTFTNHTWSGGTFTSVIASGGATLSGNVTFSGGPIFNGTTLGTVAAGNLLIGGVNAIPTMTANGEGAVFLRNTIGLSFIGQGSTYDMAGYDSAGSLVWAVPTGTTNFSVLNGDLLDRGTSPTGTAGSGYVRATHPSISGPSITYTQISKTANYVVLSTDNGTYFDISGASGTVIFTLPSYSAGLSYCFASTANQILEVLAPASTKIAIGGSNSAAAGNIQTNPVSAYANVCLVASTVNNQWYADRVTGTWNVN